MAPAGCAIPATGGGACDSNSSSIESCVNAIWGNLNEAATQTQSLGERPGDPADRMARLREAKAALLPEIRLLGVANDYNENNLSPSCAATWDGIERCEDAIGSARYGLELLTKPEVAATLSAATRDRLKQSLREHEAQYTAQLDLIVASGQGEPSQLCNATYASVASCERAVAADSKAIREQIFPAYYCGRLIPGTFVTAKDAAAKSQRDAGRPEPRMVLPGEFTFDVAVRFYGDRLRQERALLEKARGAR
jgi:hypothetical protein